MLVAWDCYTGFDFDSELGWLEVLMILSFSLLGLMDVVFVLVVCFAYECLLVVVVYECLLGLLGYGCLPRCWLFWFRGNPIDTFV